ncbi:MAG TPA: hypothetical protein PLX02_15495 [Syntrophorhabdaceae bacterium]|nr:hypothetical protein [Syntrophorhabdaceae bacterium]HQM83008.1 hypothetical protein [Syntrophorhabdaceae bacterium]
MAIRIGKATDTSPESWLSIQAKLDLWNTMKKGSRDVARFKIQKTVRGG